MGSGGPDPDRAEPGFQGAGSGLGLNVNGLAGLKLKVCVLTGNKIIPIFLNMVFFLFFIL